MFSFKIRVYYEDTDASGVVYHARYLAFFERARTEFLRHLGYQQQLLMSQLGIAFTLSDLQIKFAKPARLDDELIIHTKVTKLGRASVSFQQEMYCADQMLASLTVRAGCVAFENFKPCAMPKALIGALREYLDVI